MCRLDIVFFAAYARMKGGDLMWKPFERREPPAKKPMRATGQQAAASESTEPERPVTVQVTETKKKGGK
jgi:hypothetical protein